MSIIDFKCKNVCFKLMNQIQQTFMPKYDMLVTLHYIRSSKNFLYYWIEKKHFLNFSN